MPEACWFDRRLGEQATTARAARSIAAGGLRIRISEVGEFPARPTLGEVQIVDGADVLGDEALRSLALAGGPAVIGLLPRSVRVLARLGARLAVVRLSPLSPAEAIDFLAAALDAGQIQRDFFEEGALTALALASGGMPRELIVRSRGAFFQAHLERAPCVKARHIELAEALRLGVKREVLEAASAPVGYVVADDQSQNAPVGSVEAAASAAPADLVSASLARAAGPALEVTMRPADVAAACRLAARPLARRRTRRLALAVSLWLGVPIVAGWFLLGQRWAPQASESRWLVPSLVDAPASSTSVAEHPRSMDELGLAAATVIVAAAVPVASASSRPEAMLPSSGAVEDTAAGLATPPTSEYGGPTRRDPALSPGTPVPAPPGRGRLQRQLKPQRHALLWARTSPQGPSAGQHSVRPLISADGSGL